MSRVRSRNTSSARVVRSLLHGLGYRFRIHRKDLPGTPDIVLPKYYSVVFVHGCFWRQHNGCKRAALPKTNSQFWEQKLNGNVERDKRATESLRLGGWRVLHVWECETQKSKLTALAENLGKFLHKEKVS